MNYLKLDIDLLLNNQEDEVIAIAQIKAGTPPVVARLHDIWLQEFKQLLTSLQHREIYLEYGFLMDYQQIVVLTISPDREWLVNQTLETSALVKKYGDSDEDGFLNDIYLEMLLERWINDIIERQKSDRFPYQHCLENIGFSAKIEAGKITNLNNLKAAKSFHQDQFLIH